MMTYCKKCGTQLHLFYYLFLQRWLLFFSYLHKQKNINMKAKHFIIPMLLCAALVSIACGGNSNSDTKSGTQTDTTDTTQSRVVVDTIVRKPSSSTLLFDASRSMHGYLNSSGDSRFIGVISHFENMSGNTVVRLYGKEEGNPIERTDFDRMLNNRNIKWSDESDLKAMVRSMTGHVGGGDDVCFLLTDGILSGSNADIKASPGRSYNIRMRQKMSEDLSSLLSDKKGKLCALIARYNAKFNGRYSYYNNDWETLTNKERPFFVIAIGKWGCIKYIEKELHEAKTANGITTPYEDIVVIGDAYSYQKIKLSAAEGLNPKDGKLVIKKEFRHESVALSADLGVLPAYMQTDDYLNSNIELYVQHGKKAKKVLDKDYYEVSVNSVNGKRTLRLNVKSSQLKDAKLTFRLKYALPEWIEAKSDDDDSDIATKPAKLGKTFNLKYFISGFTALHDGKYIKEQILDFK